MVVTVKTPRFVADCLDLAAADAADRPSYRVIMHGCDYVYLGLFVRLIG